MAACQDIALHRRGLQADELRMAEGSSDKIKHHMVRTMAKWALGQLSMLLSKSRSCEA